MRRLLPVFVFSFALSVAFSFLACGGGTTPSTFNSPTPPGTNQPPPPTQASKFIYGVVGFQPDGNGPEAGQINSTTGLVTPVPGSPFDAGLGQSNILQVLADPKGRFIYTLHQQGSSFGDPIGQSGIGEQKSDPHTGALTIAPNSPIVFPASESHSTPLAIEGSGRFVYQVIATGFEVYIIDQNTGTLTKSSSSSTAIPLGANIVASPDGRFLFNSGNGSVDTLSIDQQTGQLALVPGTLVPTGGSGGPLAIEKDGKFLYAANSTEGTISVLAISSTGTLMIVPGSPFTTGIGSQFLVLTPDNRFLYGIFEVNPSVVEGFRVDPGMGAFASIQGFAPVQATALALDGSGKFAYLSQPDGSLGTFAIDPGSGVLTKVSSASQPVTDIPSNLVTVP